MFIPGKLLKEPCNLRFFVVIYFSLFLLCFVSRFAFVSGAFGLRSPSNGGEVVGCWVICTPWCVPLGDGWGRVVWDWQGVSHESLSLPLSKPVSLAGRCDYIDHQHYSGPSPWIALAILGPPADINICVGMPGAFQGFAGACSKMQQPPAKF